MKKLTSEITTSILKAMLNSLPISSSLLEIFKEINRSNSLTSEKIEKAYKSLHETSSLIDDLQKDLNAKVEMVTKLKSDYEHYSKLAELEEAKIKPLLNELSKTIDKGKGRERWINFAISLIVGFLLFVLGIWLSPKITDLFNSSKLNTQVEQTTHLLK
jgi:hypothetical protein